MVLPFVLSLHPYCRTLCMATRDSTAPSECQVNAIPWTEKIAISRAWMLRMGKFYAHAGPLQSWMVCSILIPRIHPWG